MSHQHEPELPDLPEGESLSSRSAFGDGVVPLPVPFANRLIVLV